MSGYDKTVWFSGATPAISVSNLAKLEDGLEAALGFGSVSELENFEPTSIISSCLLNGSIWNWVSDSGESANGYGGAAGTIIEKLGHTGLGRWHREVGGRVLLSWFASPLGDNDTQSVQSAFDFSAGKFSIYVDKNPHSSNGLFRLTSPVLFQSDAIVLADGLGTTGFVSMGCDALISSTGAIQVTIKGVGFWQAVRNSNVENSCVAVKFNGTASSRPFWNTVKDCWFDGFGLAIDCSWLWSSTIDNCKGVYLGSAVRATGLSVNNRIVNCNFSGSGGSAYGLLLGNGVDHLEGWIITDNVIASFGGAIRGLLCGHVYIANNILDLLTNKGILIQNDTDGASANWHILNNYIAVHSGSVGIHLNDSQTSSHRAGHIISNNIILGYTALSYAIAIDGGKESDTLIDGNNLRGSVYDLYINNLAKHRVVNNRFESKGAYFTGSVPRVMFQGNEGNVRSSGYSWYAPAGVGKAVYSTARPSVTNGSFEVGDTVYSTDPMATGGFVGWKCVVSGTPGLWASFGDLGNAS